MIFLFLIFPSFFRDMIDFWKLLFFGQVCYGLLDFISVLGFCFFSFLKVTVELIDRVPSI